MLKEVVLLGIGAISFINRVDKVQSASRDSRSENIVVHPAIVAELDLGDRHKGQSLGNKPDRQGLIKPSFAIVAPAWR